MHTPASNPLQFPFSFCSLSGSIYSSGNTGTESRGTFTKQNRLTKRVLKALPTREMKTEPERQLAWFAFRGLS
jgi:hypothetical protein